MAHYLSSWRRQRASRPVATAVASTAVVLALALPGIAVAGGWAPVKPPPTDPTSADQIQNIDQVRTAIKGYYGDTVTSAVDPVPNAVDGGDVALHTFSASDSYAAETADLAADALEYLTHFTKQDKASGTKAIVLDVDDTTLNTFNYEIYSNFAYNPTINGYFVNAAVFPAVPGMPELVAEAASQGYEIFYLTGRPEAQRTGTSTNLTNAGYATPAADHLILKSQALPWLSSCTPTCSSATYKALTRQYLVEDLGYDIVANFGDQPSDFYQPSSFTDGYQDETFTLPNPMYFLP